MNPYFILYKSIGITWFMVVTVVAIVLSYIMIKNNETISSLNKNKKEDIFFILIILGFIGARLGYVILNFVIYRDNLYDIFKLYHFNLNLAGAVALSLLGLYVISKKEKLSFNELLRVYIIPFYFSMSIGIWVMFFDGLLVGKEYMGILSFNYLGADRHIVSLYLSILFLIGLIIELLGLKKTRNKYNTVIVLIFVLIIYYSIKVFFSC